MAYCKDQVKSHVTCCVSVYKYPTLANVDIQPLLPRSFLLPRFELYWIVSSSFIANSSTWRVCHKAANVAYGLCCGVLYFRNVRRFHGTRVSVILNTESTACDVPTKLTNA